MGTFWMEVPDLFLSQSPLPTILIIYLPSPLFRIIH